MSSTTKLIKCQQEILKDLGLYNGPVDGFWGKVSESAMAGFQHTSGFAGLRQRLTNSFFAPFEPLPKGWTWSEDGTTISVNGIAPEIAPEPVVAPVVEVAAVPQGTDDVVLPISDEFKLEISAEQTEEIVVPQTFGSNINFKNNKNK